MPNNRSVFRRCPPFRKTQSVDFNFQRLLPLDTQAVSNHNDCMLDLLEKSLKKSRELAADNKGLTHMIDEYSERVQQLQDDLEAANKALTALQARKKREKKQDEEFITYLQQNNENTEVLTEKLSLISKGITNLMQSINTQKETVLEITEQGYQLETRLAEQAQEIARLKAQQTESLAVYQDAIALLLEKITLLEAKLSNIERFNVPLDSSHLYTPPPLRRSKRSEPPPRIVFSPDISPTDDGEISVSNNFSTGFRTPLEEKNNNSLFEEIMATLQEEIGDGSQKNSLSPLLSNSFFTPLPSPGGSPCIHQNLSLEQEGESLTDSLSQFPCPAYLRKVSGEDALPVLSNEWNPRTQPQQDEILGLLPFKNQLAPYFEVHKQNHTFKYLAENLQVSVSTALLKEYALVIGKTIIEQTKNYPEATVIINVTFAASGCLQYLLDYFQAHKAEQGFGPTLLNANILSAYLSEQAPLESYNSSLRL
jgi:hypothetical protein